MVTVMATATVTKCPCLKPINDTFSVSSGDVSGVKAQMPMKNWLASSGVLRLTRWVGGSSSSTQAGLLMVSRIL